MKPAWTEAVAEWLVVTSGFAAGAMPDSVRYNIKYLVSNLDVSLILEDLLEKDVLSEEEYDTASGKENEMLELAKYVVRLMLKKTEEQVDRFLNLIQHSQPDVAEHVASTMAERRAAKPMSADRESTRGSSSGKFLHRK